MCTQKYRSSICIAGIADIHSLPPVLYGNPMKCARAVITGHLCENIHHDKENTLELGYEDPCGRCARVKKLEDYIVQWGELQEQLEDERKEVWREIGWGLTAAHKELQLVVSLREAETERQQGAIESISPLVDQHAQITEGWVRDIKSREEQAEQQRAQEQAAYECQELERQARERHLESQARGRRVRERNGADSDRRVRQNGGKRRRRH